MVIINGKESDSSGRSVMQYLDENGYDTMRIAVEINGYILPKAQYESAVLKDGDCVEIVNFVGGG